MSTYTIRCLCGRWSPKLGSKEAMRAWHADHKRKDCGARRAEPTAASSLSATVGRARIDDAELAREIARIRPLKPTPVGAASNGPVDASVDQCGARRNGLARQWSNGQSLQASIASILGADLAKVPNPEISYAARDDWHDHYSERLRAATGYVLEVLPEHAFPPRNPSQIWIAGIHEGSNRDGHAVVAKGRYVIHDPAGIYLGSLPMDRVTVGMVLRSTQRRAVPAFRNVHALT
jgi:hypothetical protein